MNKNEINNFNGNLYKSKKSILSTIENETIEKNNNMNTGITRHRKNNLSFFYGSYIIDNGLKKLLKEYNDNNNYENIKLVNKSDENENNSIKTKNTKKNSMLKEKNLNSSNTNLNTNDNEKCIPFSNSSFYSYSIENEGNPEEIIIKDDKSSSDKDQEKSNTLLFSNNPYYEFEKNSEKYNKEKSFIQMKNTLKYIKDKDERMTESYLMALEGGENLNTSDGKNQYLPTASIIEEEKSDFIESTSKKQTFININKLITDKNLKKKKFEFEIIKKQDNCVNNNNNIDNKENISNNYILEKNHKISFDLNKITIKNSYKEEIKKNYYKKNKNNINSIYKNKLIFPTSNKKINQKIKIIENFRNISYNNKSDIIKNNKKKLGVIKKNQLYSSKEIISNKKQKTINCSDNNNNTNITSSLLHHRFNTEYNLKKIIPKIKYNITKIVNKNNIGLNKNPLNKSSDNKFNIKIKIKPKTIQYNNINDKRIDIKLSKNKTLKNNLSICHCNKKEQLNKILVNIKHNRAISISEQYNKKNYKHKNVLSSNIENLINKKNELLLHHNNKSKKDINNTSQKLYRHKKIGSISTLPNSSSSRTKLKINKKIKKNNKIQENILINNENKNNYIYQNFVLDMNNNNDIFIHISNLYQAENILKEKIKYLKINEKNEVLEELNKISNNSSKDNYIILCENNLELKDLFVFKGFFKYLDKENKFIKIYGNEKCPNFILIKITNK